MRRERTEEEAVVELGADRGNGGCIEDGILSPFSFWPVAVPFGGVGVVRVVAVAFPSPLPLSLPLLSSSSSLLPSSLRSLSSVAAAVDVAADALVLQAPGTSQPSSPSVAVRRSRRRRGCRRRRR